MRVLLDWTGLIVMLMMTYTQAIRGLPYLAVVVKVTQWVK